MATIAQQICKDTNGSAINNKHLLLIKMKKKKKPDKHTNQAPSWFMVHTTQITSSTNQLGFFNQACVHFSDLIVNMTKILPPDQMQDLLDLLPESMIGKMVAILPKDVLVDLVKAFDPDAMLDMMGKLDAKQLMGILATLPHEVGHESFCFFLFF